MRKPKTPAPRQLLALPTSQRLLYGGGVLAVAWIALDQFVLHSTSERISGGARLEDILYELSLAYLASLIFYLIVVDLPRREGHRKIYELIEPLLASILECCRLAIQEIGMVAGETMTMASHHVSDERLTSLCTRASFAAPSRMHDLSGVDASLFEYLDQFATETISSADRIGTFLPYLDIELLRLLGKVSQSGYCQFFQTWHNSPVLPSTCGAIASRLCEYREACYNLAAYLSRHIPDNTHVHLWFNERPRSAAG